MSNMRVVEVESFGGAEVLELKEVPSPTPGKDSLLIDVTAAGVNYMDLVARAGFMPAFPAALVAFAGHRLPVGVRAAQQTNPKPIR